MLQKMNKINTVAIGLLAVCMMALVCSVATTKQENPSHTYADYVHGWKITYPPEVTEIQVVQGPRKSNTVDNQMSDVIFSQNAEHGSWLFEVQVWLGENGEKKFTIRTNTDVSYKKTLEGFEFL